MAASAVVASGCSSSSVKVAVRLRPLSARERLAGASELLLCEPVSRQIVAGPEHSFTYDSVFGMDSMQSELFDELAKPLLDTFLTGFNCTILAYGQTGSGKTFSMGTGLDGNLEESTQGLIPRAVNYLMNSLMGQYGNFSTDGGKDGTPFFEIYTSFLEIYNEDIIDLLAPSTTTTHTTTTRSARKSNGFSIREDARGDIYLTGIREEKIVNGEEIFALLQKGSLSRTTKSTEMNMVSSRSHAIFTLLLRQRRNDGNSKVLASKLHFVDLAGSERLKRTQAQGERVKESISINSGLLALGNVISALGDPQRKATHIPYRDSKLTRMLQDSLGGNSQTLMIACVSPSSDSFVESLNTLKYAARAKNIQNRVQLNEELGGNGAFEVAQLKKQIATLKQEILHLRTSRRSDNSDSADSAGNGGGSSHSGGANGNDGGLKGRMAVDHAELSRLRVQNSEFKRRLTQMSKEKASLEAERDFFKSAAGPTAVAASTKAGHLKIIAELKGRIAELETNNSFNVKPPASAALNANTNSAVISAVSAANLPQTPVWLRQANVLVNKARDEIRENISTIKSIELSNLKPENREIDPQADVEMLGAHDNNPFCPSTPTNKSALLHSSSSNHSIGNVLQLTQAQFAAAVATRCESLLCRVRSDLAIKEDLIRQFEVCQAEYTSMRRNYDEKLRLLHENLNQTQRDRDLAIKKATSVNSNANPVVSNTITQRRYEERIKAMGKELNEARARLNEANKSVQNRSAQMDSTVKNLKNQLEVMRAEKTKIQTRLADETSRLRTDCFAHDTEIKELRQREYRATEAARKLKKAYEFQKILLQKRIEQMHQSRIKIRQLLLALKKKSSTSTSTPSGSTSNFINLNSPSWRNLHMDSDNENEDENENNDSFQFTDSQENNNNNNNNKNNNNLQKHSSMALKSSYEVSSELDGVDDPEHGHGHEQVPESESGSEQDDTVYDNDEDEDMNEMLMLQLNAQTEAVLNEELTMMDIDMNENEESCENNNSKETTADTGSIPTSRTFNQYLSAGMEPTDMQTGEVPRSALRHSPLISKRRDVFARLNDKKKSPFK